MVQAVFLVSIISLLFIWLPFSLKLITISAIGLISPLVCLRTLVYLVKEPGKIFPYTGILVGNLLSFLFNFLEISSAILISISSLSLMILLFIKYPKFLQNEFYQSPLIPGKVYLYLGFFILYFISPFFYENSGIDFLNIKLKLLLDLVFYLGGISFCLFSIKLAKQEKYFFLIPVIGFILLSLSSIPL